MDWNNKNQVMVKLEEKGFNLEFVSDTLKDDFEVVMEAVKNRGWNLQFASDRLKNDPEVVLEAVKTHCGAFEFAGDKIKEEFSSVENFLNSQKELDKN